MSASMLYCNGVVIAHAGRKDAEIPVVGKMLLFYFVEKFLYGGEFVGYLLFVIGVACHAHEPAYLYILKCVPIFCGKHFKALFGSETELAFFLRNVYLQQAADSASLLGTVSVDFLQQFVAVYTMYKVYERGNVFDFVALQVSYEVPFYVAWQAFVLFYKVLRPALTELSLPGFISLHYCSDWVVFGYGYERYPARQGIAYAFYLFCNPVVSPHNGKCPQSRFR